MLASEFLDEPLDIAELVEFTESGKISSKQAKDVFVEMFKSGEMPHKIIGQVHGFWVDGGQLSVS